MDPRTATASRREGGFKPEIERLRALFWSEDAGDLAPGVAGNEILTSATAVLLTALLIAEGVTVIHMNGLGTVHMFIGMVLIPPVLLKVGSTGYRFVRYYLRSHAYREKGPPLLPMRVMAPMLVVTTIAVLATGALLLAAGQKDGTLLEIHKVSFIVWLALFGVHLLAYLPRAVRSLGADWVGARREAVPGAGVRAMLVVASLGGGVALALSLLSSMSSWHA
jgi:hypothetical protein